MPACWSPARPNRASSDSARCAQRSVGRLRRARDSILPPSLSTGSPNRSSARPARRASTGRRPAIIGVTTRSMSGSIAPPVPLVAAVPSAPVPRPTPAKSRCARAHCMKRCRMLAVNKKPKPGAPGTAHELESRAPCHRPSAPLACADVALSGWPRPNFNMCLLSSL